MRKDLLLSPEKIAEINKIWDGRERITGEIRGETEKQRLKHLLEAQHLKTLNGILEIVDELVNEWCRCTLPDNIKISFSSYLCQQLQVEPAEEWLDKPDSEGWWWLIYPLGKGWSIPEVIYVGRADRKGNLIWETNYTKSIKRYRKAVVPKLPKSKE
jgi:hypothetical protein